MAAPRSSQLVLPSGGWRCFLSGPLPCGLPQSCSWKSPNHRPPLLHAEDSPINLYLKEGKTCATIKRTVCVCARACVCAQLCLTLCNPLDCSPPSSSVHGISQARLPFPPPGDLPHPEMEPVSPALAGGFLHFAAWEGLINLPDLSNLLIAAHTFRDGGGSTKKPGQLPTLLEGWYKDGHSRKGYGGAQAGRAGSWGTSWLRGAMGEAEQWDPNGFLSAGLSLAPLTGDVFHSGFYCQFLEQADSEVDKQSSLH